MSGHRGSGRRNPATDVTGRRAGTSARRKANTIDAKESDPFASTSAESWRQGARGEDLVSRHLSKLTQSWTYRNDLPQGRYKYGNIDHVLVGPPGVFTLNTKNVRGRIWFGGDNVLVNGVDEDLVARARQEGMAINQRLHAATGLSVWVTPMLVFVKPDDLDIKNYPRGVIVLPDDGLVAWLQKQERRYDQEAVDQLKSALLNDSTWTS